MLVSYIEPDVWRKQDFPSIKVLFKFRSDWNY